MKPKLLAPKNDLVFHALFRNENKKITEGLINDILEEKMKVISTDRDRHVEIRTTNEKYGILDLRAELENGVKCNIEVQLVKQEYEEERMLYYWGNTYIRQLLRGHRYEKLKKTISIIIVDHELDSMKGIENLNAKWHIRNDEKLERILTNRLEIVIIEIPKAKKLYKENPKNKVAQWMMFFDNPNSKEVEKIMKINMSIRAAIEDLGAICGSKRMRRLSELRQKGERDRHAQMQYARKEGLRQGIEEGIKQGVKQGMKQGVKQGVKQGSTDTKLRIAKVLLEQQVGIETIEKATGLTKEEIEHLKK